MNASISSSEYPRTENRTETVRAASGPPATAAKARGYAPAATALAVREGAVFLDERHMADRGG